MEHLNNSVNMKKERSSVDSALLSSVTSSNNRKAYAVVGSVQENSSLTQAGLEEYSRSYYDPNSLIFHHQKQSSYAQSEGYHSYVSSSDSSSTPFLDRLRQDSELLLSRSTHTWSSQQDLNSNSTNNSISENNSSESTSSSTETLKWLGSLSDVSVASSSALSGSGSTSQLIAHSSRVRTPQRHNSESILYMTEDQTSVTPLSASANTSPTDDLRNKAQQYTRSSRNNNRLFPISTYTEIPSNSSINSTNNSTLADQTNTKQINSHNWQSVAERINELEKQQNSLNFGSANNVSKDKYTFFDPSKTHRISNPTLKAFQKNAVQSYFERQQQHARDNNTSLNSRPTSLNLSSSSTNMSNSKTPTPTSSQISSYNQQIQAPFTLEIQKCNTNGLNMAASPENTSIAKATIIFQNNDNYQNSDQTPPPPRPPRQNGRYSGPPAVQQTTSIANVLRRTSSASEYSLIRDNLIQQRQQLSKDLLGPMIMGPIISVDDWVPPERPPKNPMLRIPSPEPPPPPPPTETDDVMVLLDEPLPPPPPELLRHMRQLSDSGEPKTNTASRRNSFAGQTNKAPIYRASPVEMQPSQGNSLVMPPAVPKKPTAAQMLGVNNLRTANIQIATGQKRPSSSMAQPQFTHAQEKIDTNVLQSLIFQAQHPGRLSDSRLSMRKRPHNPKLVPAEYTIMKNSSPINVQQIVSSPPPLKPRMPIDTTNGLISMGSTRSNSKASYLPRQPRDKLHSDPSDHGSYKLTLTSNEDSVNQFQEEILPQKCNLPDVLPVSVKYTNSRYQQHDIILPPPKNTPQTAPVVSTNSLKSMFNFSPPQGGPPPPSSTPPPQYSPPLNPNAMSPKYMSQSTFDLKKTQILEPKYIIQHTPADIESSQKSNYETANQQISEIDETITEKTITTTETVNNDDDVAKDENVISKEVSINETSATTTVTLVRSESVELSLELPKDNEEEKEVPLQRTEIVLRVQPVTTETASQTDYHQSAANTEVISMGIGELAIENNQKSMVQARKVHPEEIDCDKLSIDLIRQLSPSDKLHTILAPKTFKSSSDYVSDLFNIQIVPRPAKKDASTSTPDLQTMKSPLDILTSNSTYFQISEPKAKLMTRYSREMTLINGDCCDLTKKKEELVQRLGKKLLVLSNEQTSIAEESNANDMLGNDVAIKVAQKVRPSDASKFRSYVDDVGYITMLLLSLSGRLARTENALHNIIDDSHPDKKILEAKRDRLLEQLDEAKQLKDDIDRRGAIISKILEKSLTIEEYADFDYFINMKAKLIVDSREIAEKIKLGEEQLSALKDTLVHSEC